MNTATAASVPECVLTGAIDHRYPEEATGAARMIGPNARGPGVDTGVIASLQLNVRPAETPRQAPVRGHAH